MLSLFLFTDDNQKKVDTNDEGNTNDDLEEITLPLEEEIPPEVTVVSEDDDDQSRTESEDDNDDDMVASEVDDLYHELYLPEDKMPTYSSIRFSNNMNMEECDRFHSQFDDYESSTIEINKVTSRLKSDLSKRRCMTRPKNIESSRRKMARTSSFSSQSSDATDTTSSSTNSCSSVYRVMFLDSVTEYPVHTVEEYPMEIRSNIWSSGREVSQNKKRNKKEYKYDFCDWRGATEEDEMVLDTLTGELIHPAHLDC
mmetsp:Transcript_17931/g.23753  ORF Transcript_17931/g.23753 Transcript_17931/m.23753 type:complete len:255 (-) Transcript_17931:99-863(-)